VMAIEQAGGNALHGADIADAFVEFAIEAQVLQFGNFTTKAGRQSPYFFNAGAFDDGVKLARLAQFYAARLQQSGLHFDMLFGPAYKGIPLATALALELGRAGRAVGFAFNRKEAKDHGEGGSVVGAPLQGRVLIVDDVMSAGTSALESLQIIKAAGAVACGVVIALDRQEKIKLGGQDLDCSAVQYVRDQVGLPVCAVAGLDDLLNYLTLRRGQNNGLTTLPVELLDKMLAYRQRYGCSSNPAQ
jgi:orotate phosphoribosyltransferase